VQPPLVVSTQVLPAEHAADLIALLPATGALSWVRRGEGLVAGGVSAQVETAGLTRFADASKWWSELVARAEVVDEVAEPGAGLVCFGSFGFAAEPGDSVLIVPRWVVGRRGSTAWLTTISPLGEAPTTLAEILAAAPLDETAPVLQAGPGSLDEEEWKARVAEATARINAGELEKVVLARDITATCPGRLDVRAPLSYLATSYLLCWTFHVDGLFGATPELLVRRERGLVTSRVLAGTIRRTGAAEQDDRLAGELSRSSKDLEEHEYAVRSVADALEPHCSSMNVPEAPFVLHLPNVMHLATDVTGVARDGITSLELAAALHPSAAVGGTPRADAVDLIAEIEGMDRERYAAPVGWMDAAGDGEWGIALRSAAMEQVGDGTRVRLFAGCGVVGSSDPASELAESQAKLVPIRAALGL
jgi:menaquinone-specific isochorismate synthase